jgi:general nucleoside transport system permease protein
MSDDAHEEVPEPVGPSGERLPVEPDSTEEELARAEVAAAEEREADAKSVDLGAGFRERLIGAITGASLRVTVLALVLAFALGGLLLAISDPAVREALGYFTSRPSDTFVRAWDQVSAAYAALVSGALGSPRAITETLVLAGPLILTGLAVAVPLRAGLFNIGGEGQVIAGGLIGGWLGFSITGLPLLVHLPIALVGGMLAGAAVGWIPGILKARTGAHEVISTIMLNNMFVAITFWVLTTAAFQIPGRDDPVSQNILPTARLPRYIEGLRGDVGILLAFAVAVLVFWLMERSTRGFELNAVGRNPSAATAAGMDPNNSVVFAMTTAGGLAGLAGCLIILGIDGRITPGFSAGIGFDGITVALLGRGGIGGSVAAGLLLGGLKAGGRSMQGATQTSLDLVVVIQALIIVFIAAPKLVQAIFRLRRVDEGTAQISKGWGA